MGEVKLHGAWFSPFVRRVEVALKMKGVEYEYIEEDLRNKSALLLRYNPIHKKVPVLLHNGNPIVESTVILEYIDEVWEGQGQPILPRDHYQRSKARFWAKFVDDKCTGAMWKVCWTTGEEREKAMGEAKEALQFLENEIEGKKFFGGDTIGLVDLTANFLAYWFRVFQEMAGFHLLTQDNFPNLCKWADEYCNDTLAKENLPPKDKLEASFRAALQTGRLY